MANHWQIEYFFKNNLWISWEICKSSKKIEKTKTSTFFNIKPIFKFILLFFEYVLNICEYLQEIFKCIQQSSMQLFAYNVNCSECGYVAMWNKTVRFPNLMPRSFCRCSRFYWNVFKFLTFEDLLKNVQRSQEVLFNVSLPGSSNFPKIVK